MDWATLFERAAAHETDVETIQETLEARRSGRGTSSVGQHDGEPGDSEGGEDGA